MPRATAALRSNGDTGLPLPPAEAIPAELRARAQWAAGRFIQRHGKRTKLPLNPRTGEAAKTNDPATWSTFAEAYRYAATHGLLIGYMFSADDPYTGLDKDGCRDPETGELTPDTFILLGRVPTYTEASVSGTGIHAIARATKPGPRCRRAGSDLELYGGARFFVFTGNHIAGTPGAIMARQGEVAALYDDLFPEPAPPLSTLDTPPPCTLDDAALLDRARGARNGAKFTALYDAGDWRGQGYPSHSEGRQALCSLLAFWTGPDEEHIEHLFRRSALFPDEKKWARERADVLGNATRRAEFWRGDHQPRPPLSTVDTPPDLGGERDAIITDLRAKLAERDQRLRAIHELMTCKGMTPIERIVAYGVSIEAASAESRKGDGEDLVVNQVAIAENVKVSRQSVGGALKRWSEYGHLQKGSRPTAQRTKAGEPMRETVVRLPAKTLTDNLIIASTWTRPDGAKHVGGNGRRCPKCAATKVIETIETATIETRKVVCADCGHLHEERKKQRGQSHTLVRHRDWAEPTDEAPPLSTVDTPPCPETDRGYNHAPPPVNAATPPPRPGPIPRAPFAGDHECCDCRAPLWLPQGGAALCPACARARRLPVSRPLSPAPAAWERVVV